MDFQGILFLIGTTTAMSGCYGILLTLNHYNDDIRPEQHVLLLGVLTSIIGYLPLTRIMNQGVMKDSIAAATKRLGTTTFR